MRPRSILSLTLSGLVFSTTAWPQLNWHGKRQSVKGEPIDASGRGGPISGKLTHT